MNYVEKLKDYHEFLQWECFEEMNYASMTEQDAKEQLKEDLEFIVATNGENELFDRERELLKELSK